MNYIMMFLLTSFMLTSCKEKASSKQLEVQNTNLQQDTLLANNPLNEDTYKDEELSSFEILAKENEENFSYKAVNVNYEIVYLNPNGKKQDFKSYIAKYVTTTETCMGCEGHDRNIKVEISEFENPKKSILTINKDCDQIDLKYDTYMTTKHGCCAAEDEFEIFDYQHKSIVKADNQITVGSVPNSNIEFYIGYKNEGKSPLDVGTLTLSYGSSDKYTLYLKVAESLARDWPSFSPEIAIESKNQREQLSKNQSEYTYTLWSLDKVNTKNKINGLVIKLTFDGDENSAYNTFEIPIIEGKPFGNSSRIQEVVLGQ